MGEYEPAPRETLDKNVRAAIIATISAEWEVETSQVGLPNLEDSDDQTFLATLVTLAAWNRIDLDMFLADINMVLKNDIESSPKTE